MEVENKFKNGYSLDSDASERDENDSDASDDSPTSLIVSNIHSEVFHSPDLKSEIESLFRDFSQQVTFQWFKSFRRLRVNYDNPEPAADARMGLHLREIGSSVLKCHFAQPIILNKNSNKLLKPPKPTKQFLISPPCSPPAGWQQAVESEPIFNHELVAALSNLTPGEVHEVHAASDNQPAIIVHTAIVEFDDNNNADESDGCRPKIELVQTRCPERKSSDEIVIM